MSRILKKISAQHGLEKLRNFLRKGRIGDGLDVWGDPLSNPLIKEPLCLLGLIAVGPDKVFSSCWLHGHRSVVTDEPRTTPMGSPSRKKKKTGFKTYQGALCCCLTGYKLNEKEL